MQWRKRSSTSYPVLLYMVSSTDHVTPVTGLAPAVTLSKNGAAFAAATGGVTEVGSGVYALAGAAADRDTLGSLIVRATGTGADPFLTRVEVVAVDPFESDMDLDNLDLIDEIKAKTDLISSAAVEVVSPVAEPGVITLIKDDAYTAAHARTVDLPLTSAPDLTLATVKLHVGSPSGGVLTVTGTVLNPGTATQTCRFSYTAAQTALLTKVGEGAYEYQVRATWAADNPSQPATIGEGRVDVARQIPEV